jgi:hypothetical protein
MIGDDYTNTIIAQQKVIGCSYPYSGSCGSLPFCSAPAPMVENVDGFHRDSFHNQKDGPASMPRRKNGSQKSLNCYAQAHVNVIMIW